MGVKFNRGKGGIKSTVSVNQERPLRFMSTQSSARKYVAKDQIINPDLSAGTISNSEHVIEQAAGIRTTAALAESTAASARDDLQSVRTAIAALPPSSLPDQRKAPVSFTQHDVAVARKNSSIDVSSRSILTGPRVVPTAQDLVQAGGEMLLPFNRQPATAAMMNASTPEIDHISVLFDVKKGMLDCFYTSIVFGIPRSAVASKEIKAIRIFRTTVDNPQFPRDPGRLSFHGIDRISSNQNRSHLKSAGAGQLERQLKDTGVDNSATALVPIDPILNARRDATLVGSGAPISVPTQTNGMNQDNQRLDLESFMDPAGLTGLDRSVTRDPNSIRNLQTGVAKTSSQVRQFTPSARNGFIVRNNRPSAIQLKQSNRVSGEKFVVEKNNQQGYREIAFLSPDKLNSHIIGDQVKFLFDDSTVTYRQAYKYFITTVDHNLNESVRSQIIEAQVDGLRVPSPPKNLLAFVISGIIGMTVNCDDKFVEKYEIYRRGDVSLTTSKPIAINVISGPNGYTLQKQRQVVRPNGFQLITEVLNASGKGGATFYDRDVMTGHRYEYRVFSIDVFGNKSESPAETSVFIPDPSHKQIELRKPTMTAEINPNSGKVSISFQCDDPRVEVMFLERRDLTISQRAFAPPGQVSDLRMGLNDAQGSNRFLGSIVFDKTKDVAWNGFFENRGSLQRFIDQVTEYDHTYQYRMFGYDRFGNRTSYELSTPLTVTRRPFIDAPFNLDSSLVLTRGKISGIQLIWGDGNVDISSEDKLGNRQQLGDNSVRVLFQVQRRRVGEEQWQGFPLIEGQSFFDPTSVGAGGSQTPGYRPAYVQENQTYNYRVQALQTGSFVSNFSDPVQIFVGLDVLPPKNFAIIPAQAKIRPFYVMVNWDTDPASGVIDKWDIERVEINNLAASQINVRDPAELANLDFQPFRTIFSESNQFSADSRAASQPSTDIFPGQNHYLDSEIEFGNTYMYRIRSVSTDVKVSGWVYSGIRVEDETFTRKVTAVVPDDTKQKMTKTKAPFKPIISLDNPFAQRQVQQRIQQDREAGRTNFKPLAVLKQLFGDDDA